VTGVGESGHCRRFRSSRVDFLAPRETGRRGRALGGIGLAMGRSEQRVDKVSKAKVHSGPSPGLRKG
jgi:hypothetical protein